MLSASEPLEIVKITYRHKILGVPTCFNDLGLPPIHRVQAGTSVEHLLTPSLAAAERLRLLLELQSKARLNAQVAVNPGHAGKKHQWEERHNRYMMQMAERNIPPSAAGFVYTHRWVVVELHQQTYYMLAKCKKG